MLVLNLKKIYPDFFNRFSYEGQSEHLVCILPETETSS